MISKTTLYQQQPLQFCPIFSWIGTVSSRTSPSIARAFHAFNDGHNYYEASLDSMDVSGLRLDSVSFSSPTSFDDGQMTTGCEPLNMHRLFVPNPSQWAPCTSPTTLKGSSLAPNSATSLVPPRSLSPSRMPALPTHFQQSSPSISSVSCLTHSHVEFARDSCQTPNSDVSPDLKN